MLRRSRLALRSSTSPSWTTTIGVPSITGRARGNRKPIHDEDLEHRDRADSEERTGERVVVLRETLLDRVAEDDDQDQVERLERRQLAAADDPRQHEQEAEDDDRAKDDVHATGRS